MQRKAVNHSLITLTITIFHKQVAEFCISGDLLTRVIGDITLTVLEIGQDTVHNKYAYFTIYRDLFMFEYKLPETSSNVMPQMRASKASAEDSHNLLR